MFAARNVHYEIADRIPDPITARESVTSTGTVCPECGVMAEKRNHRIWISSQERRNGPPDNVSESRASAAAPKRAAGQELLEVRLIWD